jgi:hypothetical protein
VFNQRRESELFDYPRIQLSWKRHYVREFQRSFGALVIIYCRETIIHQNRWPFTKARGSKTPEEATGLYPSFKQLRKFACGLIIKNYVKNRLLPGDVAKWFTGLGVEKVQKHVDTFYKKVKSMFKFRVLAREKERRLLLQIPYEVGFVSRDPGEGFTPLTEEDIAFSDAAITRTINESFSLLPVTEEDLFNMAQPWEANKMIQYGQGAVTLPSPIVQQAPSMEGTNVWVDLAAVQDTLADVQNNLRELTLALNRGLPDEDEEDAIVNVAVDNDDDNDAGEGQPEEGASFAEIDPETTPPVRLLPPTPPSPLVIPTPQEIEIARLRADVATPTTPYLHYTTTTTATTTTTTRPPLPDTPYKPPFGQGLTSPVQMNSSLVNMILSYNLTS